MLNQGMQVLQTMPNQGQDMEPRQATPNHDQAMGLLSMPNQGPAMSLPRAMLNQPIRQEPMRLLCQIQVEEWQLPVLYWASSVFVSYVLQYTELLLTLSSQDSVLSSLRWDANRGLVMD